ncbi:Fe-S cluster assembly protein SufD [Endozoicomonas sp. G2_2]|uniref:Fe-S cluster assembly protein SufD n=1 Tax=Endozoicomonas sp. G2_2 TaxID=2821092 RepID=UPI001AD9F026|nr:Fe-S cluster assembly protein SufD [Endozoicomonas sp. G2_2]MBO9469199.1 Fe-S cluster assembly protein SufD [Endozoicomonas sp. G2_2]
MNDIAPLIDHYLAEYARIERQLPGSDANKRARKAALKAFGEAGFPDTRQEDWKYTSLRPVEKRRFEISDEAGDVSEDALAPFLPADLDAYRIVIVDGHFSARLSMLDGLPKGVIVQSFAEYLESDAEATVQSEAIASQPGSLSDMNAAFATDGAYVHLAANAAADKPIHVITVSSGGHEERMAQVRHRYVIDASSQATVIEHYVGLGDKPYFTNIVTEAVMGQNAQLTRCRVQQESSRGYHVASFFAHQTRDSRVLNHGFDLGGRLARTDTHARLVDPNAEVHFYGVYVPTGRQHMDNHTCVDHDTEHSVSREIYKGVLADYGRGVFNGKILIRKDAQKTDSDLSCDALLLSDKAEVDAKPELEIYADDVVAAHGSTVGQLDEDAVFYLKSRGVEDDGARAILTYSFANALVQKVGLEPVERFVEAALMSKLPGGESYADLA